MLAPEAHERRRGRAESAEAVLRRGRPEAALAAFDACLAAGPNTRAVAYKHAALAALGRREEARAILDLDRHVSASALAFDPALWSLVAQEMSAPIAVEFGRTFEEQNLGIPLEEALESLTRRVPNLDLKFFSTAIILQRQTSGDLAEILDKIGHLIRERFQIWGQVQALTGEGRLSGVVLLALPPALFAVVYRMNPDYLMLLFTDELGKKMLVGGVIMQLFGALVIRKIVNIRV